MDNSGPERMEPRIETPPSPPRKDINQALHDTFRVLEERGLPILQEGNKQKIEDFIKYNPLKKGYHC